VLEFRLLGPLEAREGDQALPVRRQKQRALLALLLLHAGRPVSKERLIDGLWGESAPKRAKGALENYVSQLRKVLGKDVLTTEPAGYLLRIEPEQVDAGRFERLVGEAREAADTEDRAAKLVEALALFRGPPLADLLYEPFAEVEVLRLEELELAAREELIDAELALGRHADVVSELEALIAKHPYRERLRGQLMLALYRSGRQADALAAYQSARRALVDQLGIEPGDELQLMEQAILRQDEALRAPPRKEQLRPVAAQTPRAGRKTVTILHSRLAGAGSLAERLDPELLGTVFDRFASEVRGAAERHGGTVETAPGDSVTAVFGVPAAREDDALRALRAAAELGAALSRRSADEPVEAQTGVATGEVFVGGAPGGRIATGAAVEVADRLARAAGAGEVLLDGETRALAGDALTVEPRDSGASVLLSLEAEPGARRLRIDSPLIGRDRQLAALQQAFRDTVVDRACRLFTVLGAAGVGKSRLARELIEALGGEAAVLEGRCLPYGEGVTFWPLVEALEAGVPGDAEVGTAAGAPATTSLVLTADAVAATRPADVLGLVAEGAAPGEITAATQALLSGLARARPLVVVFDDLHWAEPPFLDLVEHVAERTRDAPLLVVCLARPELIEVRRNWGGGKPNASSISLDPLTDDECETLVDALLGESDLPEPVRGHIVRSSEGNPLFVEELLGSLVDREVLRQEDGRWTTTELPVLAVPPSLRALIASRLDLLPDDERAVLELASVEGKRFHAQAVAELAPEELRPGLDEHLAGLVRRDLVRAPQSPGRSYAFRHQLVRDAAYDSIPKQSRAELHERFAGWLEGSAAAGTPELEELVTYHRDQASGYRKELGIDPV
jgi:DNA-binding SARP family transcriptional activator